MFRAEQGVDDPEVQAAMEELFTMVTTIADDPDVDVAEDPAFAGLDDDAIEALEAADLSLWEGITLVSPYDEAAEQQIATEGPEAGRIAFAVARDPRRRLGGGRRDRPHPRGSSPRPSTACRSSWAARPSASSRSRPPRPWAWPSRW